MMSSAMFRSGQSDPFLRSRQTGRACAVPLMRPQRRGGALRLRRERSRPVKTVTERRVDGAGCGGSETISA